MSSTRSTRQMHPWARPLAVPGGAQALLALAFTFLLAAPPARADQAVQPWAGLEVKLYGFLNAEVEWVRALGGATPLTSRARVSDGNSRLGLAGSYALSADTKVLVQLEGFLGSFEQGGVDDTGKSMVLESRNSFVGVEDRRAGRLVAGYHDSAYRTLVGTGGDFGGNWGLTATGLDLWNNTSAAVSGGFTSLFGRGESRMKNSLHYTSPELYGAKVMVSYGLDEQAAAGGRRDHLSAAALYHFGALGLPGLKIGVGYDHQANTGVDTDKLVLGLGMGTTAVNDVDTSFYKVIVSWLAPTQTYLGFGYERAVYGYANWVQPVPGQVTSPIVSGTQSQGGAMISLAQGLGYFASPLDGATLMASWGKLGNLSDSIYGSGADYGASQWSLGVKYAFGAPFMAYAYFTRVDNKPLQSLNLGSALYSNHAGTSDAFLAPGNKPTAGGVGLIARF
jgi:predicted porin